MVFSASIPASGLPMTFASQGVHDPTSTHHSATLQRTLGTAGQYDLYPEILEQSLKVVHSVHLHSTQFCYKTMCT